MSLRSVLDQKLTEEANKSVLDRFEDWYAVPALGALFAFMLWVRLQAYDNFVRGGEIYFRGNDAWYQLRETSYAVQNWPFTMPFDVWTSFPYGTSAAQFGTLYDQIAATVIIVLSPFLGDQAAGQVMLVFAPVIASLALFPTYLLAKRFGGRLAGVFSALILALLPGTFLGYTLVGFFDHHAGEVLFQVIAVLAFVAALAVAERHKPVWELVVDRDTDALKTPTAFAALAGTGAGLYMLVWPPGILLIGFSGIYFAVAIVSDVARNQSPEPTAFVGAVSMTIAGFMMLIPLSSLSFGVTSFSLLQVLLPIGVAVGCLVLAYLAREWEARDIESAYYPAAILGLIIASLGLFAVVLPGVYGTISGSLLSTVGFSQGAGARTIGEAQPFLSESLLRQQRVNATGRILSEYGMTLFTGVIGAAWLLGKPLVKSDNPNHTYYVIGSLGVVALIFALPGIHRTIADAIGIEEQLFALLIVGALIVGATLQNRYDADKLYLIVWAAFITSAAFTQTRFNYYLAIVVAVMNGYLLAQVLGFVNLRRSLSELIDTDRSRLIDAQGWQVITIVAVVCLVLGPVLLVPVTVGGASGAGGSGVETQTAWESANQTGPGAVTAWDGTLQWMNEETPEPGTLGGADNSMAYYGTYERPASEDFEYPAGAYGVMSWWDYGHWITTRAERIPHANPFQQGSTTAANYLLAPDEESAEAVAEAQSEADAPIRYVMIDWQMVAPSSKFVAPVTFYDESNVTQEDFVQTVFVMQADQQGRERVTSSFRVRSQRYYESQMVRLYYYHGSAREPAPVVLDWEERQFQSRETGETTTYPVVQSGGEDPPIRTFDNMTAAREYADSRETAQVGGFGPYPEERVDALQHYRLIKVSETSAANRLLRGEIGLLRAAGIQNPQVVLPGTASWVKSFERVPGATIEGSNAPANSTVTAQTQLRIPTTNETFTYTQQAQADENGEFTMVLPYSTTDYDEYGPENGYTNVSVRATGPYTFSTPPQVENQTLVQNGAQVTVSEGRVNGDIDDPKQVTLEERESDLTSGNSGQGSSEQDDSETNSAVEADSAAQTTADPSASIAGYADAGTLRAADA